MVTKEELETLAQLSSSAKQEILIALLIEQLAQSSAGGIIEQLLQDIKTNTGSASTEITLDTLNVNLNNVEELLRRGLGQEETDESLLTQSGVNFTSGTATAAGTIVLTSALDLRTLLEVGMRIRLTVINARTDVIVKVF